MFNRFLGDKWEQVKTLYARLTPSQRLTIAVLGATVAVALLTIALLTGRASYTALARHNDGVELRRMESELRSAGYGVRVHGGTLEVQETQLPGALNFVANRVTGTPRRDGWAWLEEDPKWGETSVRLKEKVLRKKTINLEESIKMSPDIVDAIIELNIKPAGLTVLSGGAEDNSASVLVHLAPGVGRLKSGQVRVIRNVVSGGAPVPLQMEDAGHGAPSTSSNTVDELMYAHTTQPANGWWAFLTGSD